MKGFLNKRDKIKWENTPFQPALTDADLIDRIEDNARKLLEGDPTPPLAETINNLTQDLIADTINLNYLHDVDASHPDPGDILMRSVSSTWEKRDPDLDRGWYKLDTITSDGTSATIRVPLLTLRPNYQRQLQFFITCEIAQGASDASFGIVFEFTGSPTVRRSVGDINGAISAGGKRYLNAHYLADGPRFGGPQLWHGFITNASSVTTGQAALNERLDSYYLPTVDTNVEYVEFRTQSSGAVIPEGSKFDIYIYCERFEV